MASKFIAYCPKCLDRDLPVYMMPCAGCGFPPFWPHTYPNMFRADESYELKPSGEVVELQAVKPVEEGVVVLPKGTTIFPSTVTVGDGVRIIGDEALKPAVVRSVVITDDDFAPSGAGIYTVPPDAVVAAPNEAIVIVDEATQPEPDPEPEAEETGPVEENPD